MKNKTLFLIPILAIALAVSGCGKKETPKPVANTTTNVQQVNENMNANSNVNENQNAGVTEDEDGEKIDTSDWLTYRNEEYGFEVSYPEGWKVADKDEFRIFNIEVDKKAKENSAKIATESVAFFNGIHIKINHKKESLENFVNTEFNNDPTGENYPEQGRSKLTNKTKVNFPNGMTALSVTCDRAVDPCRYILLETDDYIFQFSNYCAGNDYKFDTQKQCNQVLSTFKFID